MKNWNRREFLSVSALGALAPLVLPASVLGLDGEVAPSNRLTMGGIGIGSRGSEDLRVFLSNKDVHFVGDADCQRSRREAVRNRVIDAYGNNDCVIYSDMYEV
ncbi:MAG: gfo/Idh/MocA family oxidoreductase, partial [Thermoguttaceae bacterium]|nr:gfo/Idh/MocA family oxidoreductase [Thermoguttaceae bacterium]